jgi:hypothetical protein
VIASYTEFCVGALSIVPLFIWSWGLINDIKFLNYKGLLPVVRGHEELPGYYTIIQLLPSKTNVTDSNAAVSS